MAYPIWQATITDDNGNVLPGAEITVVNEETGLNATLYSTRNGTAKSNPFFATVDGFTQFYAEPGLYRITATDGGTGTTQTFRYVRLVELATTAEAIAGTADVLPDAEQVHLAIRGLAVGTVSQSGGVPTGAIIERGSNANGEYTKFADGTQICTVARSIGGAWATGVELDRKWNFPIAFSISPIVLPVVYGGDSAGNGIAQLEKAISTTAITVRVKNNTVVDIGGLSANIEKLTAIGRWY